MTTMLAMSIGSAKLSGACAAATDLDRVGPATTVTADAVLTVHPDGTAEIGAHPSEGADVIRDFVPRFGDPVPLLTSLGQSYTGTEVTVAALASMAAQCTADADPALYVSHPMDVPAAAIDDAACQLRARGFTDIRFVPDAVAAAAWAQSSGDLAPGDVAAVYDLGAAGATITLVQVGSRPGLATILGAPVYSEEFSGGHIDVAMLRRVLQGTEAAQPGWSATSAAPDQLKALRDACRAAKESLSTESAATIPVRLGSVATDIRVVRAELEDLIGPAAQASVDLLHDALRRADLNIGDVTAVVAAGGGSSMPLITELLSRTTRLPIAVAHQPGATAALGALAIGAAMQSQASAAAVAAIDPGGTSPTAPAVMDRDPVQPIPLGDNISEMAPAPRVEDSAPSATRRWVYRGAAAAVAVAAVGIGFALHSGQSDPPHATAQAATTSSSAHSTGKSTPTSPSGIPTTSGSRGTSTAPNTSGNTANGTAAASTPGAAPRATGGQATSGQTAANQAPANQAPVNQAGSPPAPAQGPVDQPAPAPAQNPDPNQSGSQLTLPAPTLPVPRLGTVTHDLLNP